MATLIPKRYTQAAHGQEKWRALSLRHVTAAAPFNWFAQAWKDLGSHLSASLSYGLLVAILGVVVLAYPMHPYALAALLTSFMLVAPILAAGLVALSRQHSRGEPARFDNSLATLRNNRGPLLRFACMLASFAALWFVVSGWLLAQIFGAAPSVASTVMGDVLRNVAASQIAAYFAVGAVFAAIVFVLSAITVPLIIDRGVGVRHAMATSVRVVFAADPLAMLVWAVICAVLAVLGFVSMMVGMILVFPLLGHASWYAYLDLVK
ncbi:MAG: DUF2189 domain-containing protein [Pseudomonadales bacterium]